MRRTLASLLLFLVFTAAPAWSAPRSQAGLVADAPFLTSTSAIVIDDIGFLVGESQSGDPGLATYRIDPETGALTFLAGRSHRELGLRTVAALAASPDGDFLYLLGQNASFAPRILIFAVAAGGALTLVEDFAAAGLGTGTPRSLAINSNGYYFYASSTSNLVFYDRNLATGKLTLHQTQTGSSFDRLLLSPDGRALYVAGSTEALRTFYVHGPNGTLDPPDGDYGILIPEATFDDFAAFGMTVAAGRDLAQSPDGRYVYLLGLDDSGPTDTYAVLAFETLSSGILTLKSRGPGSANQAQSLAIAVNPRNGTLYLGTFDEDESETRLAAYPPKDNGRDFFGQSALVKAPAVPGYVNFPLVLSPTADGNHAYFGAFDGLPLELFETAGAAGTLTRGAAGQAGVFGLAEMQDLAISPSGQRILLASPAGGRVGELQWDGSLRFVTAVQVPGNPTVERLTFVDENHVAGLVSHPSGGSDLQLFELAEDGALTPRGSRFALGEVKDLWASPDGGQLYVVGEAAIRRFEYRPADATLISRGLVGDLGGFGPVRFSADGRTVLVVANEEALVIPLYHTLIYRFDPASGTLAAEPEDPELASGALDYAFSPDGNELYVLKNGPDLDDLRVQVRRRGQTGTWSVGVQQLILSSAATRIDRPAQLAIDAAGRRLAVLGTADGKLFLFDRDPATGLLTQVSSESGALTLPGTPFRDRLGEIAFGPGGNELWLLDPGASRLAVSRFGCDPLAAGELCLGEAGRFRVEVDWRTGSGRGSARRVVAPASDSGLFYFFNADNWEMLVKVLDACAINGKFWVFAAATTDVGYDLRVVDTASGRAKVYQNALGTASPAITDIAALDICPATADPADPAIAVSPAATGKADGDATVLRLRDRFELEVTWQSADASGPARVVPFGSADSGLFYFFSDNNWEMLVKVLDGCAINQHFWVLAAATTDVGYTLEVRDLLTGGEPRRYTNSLGQASPAIIDLAAFGGCTSPAENP